MPQTEIRRFRDTDGSIPSSIWLDRLEKTQPKVRAKCLAAILELGRLGFELHRPLVEHLGDQIYELRVARRHINYRILFFYFGQIAVLSHGLTKEDKVPPNDIDLAKRRRAMVNSNPRRHLV
jgi:phage-related protein